MVEENESWHMSKSVSVGQIVSILLLIGALATMWSDSQKGITSNALEIKHTKELLNFQVRHAEDFKLEIRAQLDRVDKKLDTLINRELDNGSK